MTKVWPRKTLAERFWPKVAKSDGCWLWLASTDARGYGQILSPGRRGKPLAAHRVSYELAYGPIGSGLVIDHLCRNSRCVRPEHLEAVTQAENIRRGMVGNPDKGWQPSVPSRPWGKKAA
jgi:hypothetical protein